MFDFESLIGLDKDLAIKTLNENGYNDIEVVINSKDNTFCDTLLVAKASDENGKVRLICGEFYLKIRS